MKSKNTNRSYQMTTRAAAAEATGERILKAFTQRMQDQWFEDITLDLIAKDAEVTVQTVIRRFGSKEGLLEAAHHRLGHDINARRDMKPDDIEFTIEALARDYEEVGLLIMRLLSQEDRYPVLKKLTDHGREGHRTWLSEVFASSLKKLTPAKRTATLDALVVATDLYVWKLVRVDLKRPVAAYKAMVRTMLKAALHLADEPS